MYHQNVVGGGGGGNNCVRLTRQTIMKDIDLIRRLQDILEQQHTMDMETE